MDNLKNKKRKLNTSFFNYKFEIIVRNEKYEDTYLLQGTEEKVINDFFELVEIEKKRFTKNLKFNNEIIDLHFSRKKKRVD